MRTRIVQFIAILFTCTAAMAAAPAAPPTASELLDKYTQALDSTQSFISTSESSALVSSRVPSWGLESHNEKSFHRTEERTDGKGRCYDKDLWWGEVRKQQLTEAHPNYDLTVVGSDFRYRDEKNLGQPEKGEREARYKGHVYYDVKGGRQFDQYQREWGYFMGDSILGHFLGYMSAWRRLDEMLKGARSLSVRPKPETLNGAVCYVLEANTKFGRFTLWLDSEHGYHPARIRASVRVGDDIGRPDSPHIITSREAITREYSVDNVRFGKVDGVWVPMEADAKRYVVLGNEHGFSDETTHYKRSKIVLNPDHDALDSFADPMKNPALDPNLVNGSIVLLESSEQCTWQDGVVVDPKGKVVLDLRANIPKPGRTSPGGKK